jgi:hypothetical protein
MSTLTHRIDGRGDGSAGEELAVEHDDDDVDEEDDAEEDYDYTYGYGENGYENDDYPAYDYEGEGDDYYGESDEYGDGYGDETFESKFGSLKRFALNVHTGKYDNDIDLELRSDVIAETAGNRREIDPAELEERRAIAVESLKSQLKALTRQADAGILSRISLFSSTITSNVEDQVLSHDPSTEMHWKELFTALDNADKAIKITNISIRKIEMKKVIFDQLVRFLRGQTSTLKFITFNNANLCREDLLSLSTLVEQCPVLHTLELSHIQIDDINVATCLSRSLRSRTRTIYLHLPYCNLGNNPEILSVILQSEVSCINLFNNSIDSLGVVKIAECIEGDLPTEHLDLGNNNLNDEDAVVISQALKRNTTLTELKLEKNNFTSVGVKALFSSVFDNSSLNAISQSNHKCDIHVANFESSIQNHFLLVKAHLDQTDKILLALLDKESLLEYLSDVPIEFMPEVLAFLQRNIINSSLRLRSTLFYDYMEPSHTLNMLYACMRWWNMLSLYSFHGNAESGIKRKRNCDDT